MAGAKTRYRAISLILVADFCLFIGFDEMWIHSALPGGAWIMPYKGFIYLSFYLVYAYAGSMYLASLSALSAFFHFLLPIFEGYGVLFGIDYYQGIMIGYCILQLLGAFTGVCHEHFNRHFPHLAWRNFTHSNH